jgi:AraC-like DNA-binding protein
MLGWDTDSIVLTADPVFRRDGIEIADVACRHRAGPGQTEASPGLAVVFVRRGSFARRADGCETVLDPTVAYAINPDEEQRYDHYDDAGDSCTAVFLPSDVVAQLWGGVARLPTGPLPTTPEVDLDHRLLFAAAKSGDNPHEVIERTLGLLARTLAHRDGPRVASGRPATAAARRALADGVRESLSTDRERSLLEIARELSISPHHLSRSFRAVTGVTISRHRMRLRVRDALEQLAGGAKSLAQVAAAAGFADQSHLCRVIREETGLTPSALRDRFTTSER